MQMVYFVLIFFFSFVYMLFSGIDFPNFIFFIGSCSTAGFSNGLILGFFFKVN